MGQKAPAVWNGTWTGLNVLQLIKGVVAGREKAYAFALDGSSIDLWEITKDGLWDGGTGRVESAMETRAMTGRSEFELKELTGFELWLDQIVGTVNLRVLYRQDEYPCWRLIGEKEVCALAETCQTDSDCFASVRKEPGYRTRLGFRMPAEVCSTMDGRPSNLGYVFQFRIEWEGRARLKKALARFAEKVEAVVPEE
jgi:hypothetical protein